MHIRFLKHFCRGRFSGMWRCVVGRVVPDVSKGRCVLLFMIKQFRNISETGKSSVMYVRLMPYTPSYKTASGRLKQNVRGLRIVSSGGKGLNWQDFVLAKWKLRILLPDILVIPVLCVCYCDGFFPILYAVGLFAFLKCTPDILSYT
jgi:hypothetical protein